MTDASITEIAFASGFHDSNYFSSCFSKMTGRSPSEYRRQVQNAHEIVRCEKPH
jgi:transcriptional regulator GlxA family with amidase domain